MAAAMKAVVACAAVAVGSASEVPLYLWSNSARASSGIQRRQRVEASELSSLVKDSFSGSGRLSVFTFDDLHALDVAPLTAQLARTSGSSMNLLAHALSTAAYGVSVKEADVSSSDIKGLASVSDCKVFRVAVDSAIISDDEISREQYEAMLEQQSEGCSAFYVPLLRSKFDSEMAFAIRSAAVAAKTGAAVNIVTADPESSFPRLLGATAVTDAPKASNSTGLIYMTPPILEGLLISLVLIFFLAVGLSCVVSIQSPDQLFSTSSALPAGKEY